MTDAETRFKSGFVSITGAPNVGKSTLLNRILGEKLSITSKKPQTTRNRILGVSHQPSSQIVFIDTPGIHEATNRLNVRIVDAALSALKEVDLILWVIDAAAPEPKVENLVVGSLKPFKKNVFLVLNKIDIAKKSQLLSLMETWAKAYPFEEMIPVSAKKGTQIDLLISIIEKWLPYGPPFFPRDIYTDMPERFIAGEIIREKVFRLTGQEIPYATAVTVDNFAENRKKKLTTIHASIHVERDSQKGILIGKNGQKLKKIGEEARKDIEAMLGTQVLLKIFVHVQKKWRQDTRALRRFGY